MCRENCSRVNVWGLIVLGGISWEKFHGEATVWRVFVLEELFDANCPAGKSPEDNYPWGKIYRGHCLGGLCHKENYLKVIVWRAKVSKVIVLGGVSLGVMFCGREVCMDVCNIYSRCL